MHCAPAIGKRRPRSIYRPAPRDGAGHCGCGSTAELRLPKSPTRVRPPPSARIGHAPVAQWSGRLAYTEDIMGSNPIGSTIIHGDVAQQVGHLASNEKAAGSTPAISTTPTTSRQSKPVRWRSASCMRAHGHHTVRAPAIGYGTRSHARIAQPAERRSRKAQVRGSTPRAGSMASITRCRSPSTVGSTPIIDGIVRVA